VSSIAPTTASAGPDGSLRICLLSFRASKVGQHAITDITGDEIPKRAIGAAARTDSHGSPHSDPRGKAAQLDRQQTGSVSPDPPRDNAGLVERRAPLIGVQMFRTPISRRCSHRPLFDAFIDVPLEIV
jgi:hypothetical protein